METGIQRTSVHRIAKFDLGLTPFKLKNVERLIREDVKKRNERGKRLLRYMTLENLGKIFFTDGKVFKLQTPNNRRNGRIYGVNLNDIIEKEHSEESKFLVSVMVSVGVSKLGKASIHFVTPDAKINNAYYCNEVLSQLLPEMEQLSNGDYINKMELVHTHQKVHSLTWGSIAVSF